MIRYKFYDQLPINTAKFLERKIVWYAWRGDYDGPETLMCSGNTEAEAVINLLEFEQ